MPSASVSPKWQRPRTSSPLSDGAAPSASDLQIAGLVPLSTVDWPGTLSATVFCQGCPWNCAYCHNPSLIDCTMPGIVEWDDVMALLSRRRGLLDAVVFTGGEATRQAALLPAMQAVREAGFAVGLHTAGAYPNRVRALAPLVDWVGLDIKALPEDYGEVAGATAGGAKAWRCLEILLAAGVETEVRLTVHPGSAPARTALEIAREVRRRGATTFALQNARTEGTRAQFAARPREGWDETWRRLCEDMHGVGFPELRCR